MIIGGVPTESSIMRNRFWLPAMGVKPTCQFLSRSNRILDEDPDLESQRMLLSAKINKCVIFEAQRVRARLSYVCSFRYCISLSCLYHFCQAVFN